MNTQADPIPLRALFFLFAVVSCPITYDVLNKHVADFSLLTRLETHHV